MSLLTRTINFLQPLSQLSPPLAKDHDILNNIRMNLHIENSQPYSTSSSFST